jgi:hypothetical protein
MKKDETDSCCLQLIAALGVNFGIAVVAVIPAWFVVRKIGTEAHPQSDLADGSDESRPDSGGKG